MNLDSVIHMQYEHSKGGTSLRISEDNKMFTKPNPVVTARLKNVHNVEGKHMYKQNDKVLNDLECVFAILVDQNQYHKERLFLSEPNQMFHNKKSYGMEQLMNVLDFPPKVNALRAPSDPYFDREDILTRRAKDQLGVRQTKITCLGQNWVTRHTQHGND